MNPYKYLFTGMLCLVLTIYAEAQSLQKKISIDLKEVSLQAALQEIHTQYGVQFSYINNDLPATPLLSLKFKNASLQEVLERLLNNTSLGYAERGGHIIISKNIPKKEAAPAPLQTPAPTPEKGSSAAPKEVSRQISSELPAAAEPQAAEALADTTAEAKEQPKPYKEAAIEGQKTTIQQHIKSPAEPMYASIDRVIFSKIESTEAETVVKPYHFGILYPLSNHGTASGNYVNRLSMHLLIGYSAGLDGFEASAIGNIENSEVKGVQLAGYFNVVKGEVEGAQLSGFSNFTGDNFRGGQLAGFSNFNRRQLNGAQFSGFGNLSGKVNGAQFAGFGNITKRVQGVQFAGFGNIADTLMHGVQGGGFGNIARHLEGVQLGGFGNIAKTVVGTQAAGFGNVALQVEGMQLAGFINTAAYVKGVQLGFINVADSIDGVPIGFLSIVRKGHRSLEIWAADDLEANLAFKIGVDRFYNIFALSSQVQEPRRWGFGYGVGAQWQLGNRLRLNTDAISYHVFEKAISERWDWEEELNQLNKFRLLAGWQFARRFSIFAGPTYNVMVSQHKGADGQIGSRLPEHSFYDKTFRGRTNVKMWIGFNAGLRF